MPRRCGVSVEMVLTVFNRLVGLDLNFVETKCARDMSSRSLDLNDS